MLQDALTRAVADRERRGVGVSTVERVRHSGGEVDVRVEAEVEGVHVVTVERQRVASAPLDLLRSKGLITEEMFKAGDMLRNQVADAVLTPPNVLGEPSGFRAVSSDPAIRRTIYAAESGQAAREARDKLPGVVRDIVMLVCFAEPGLTMAEVGKALGYHDRRSAQVAAMAVLRVGLGILARHYGLALDARAKTNQNRHNS